MSVVAPPTPVPPTIRAAPKGRPAAGAAPSMESWAVALVGAGLITAGLGVYTSLQSLPGSRLLYLHVPAAIDTFAACGLVFISSLAFLWNRHARWDELAHASARIAVVLCSLVLITGMIWARDAWGRWWVWSPRLTFSLVLWILYAVYLLLRRLVRAPERRAVISALYGVIAFLDVPLVWVSVKLLPDIHPQTIQPRPDTRLLLAFWFLAVSALAVTGIGFTLACMRRHRPEA